MLTIRASSRAISILVVAEYCRVIMNVTISAAATPAAIDPMMTHFQRRAMRP